MAHPPSDSQRSARAGESSREGGFPARSPLTPPPDHPRTRQPPSHGGLTLRPEKPAVGTVPGCVCAPICGRVDHPNRDRPRGRASHRAALDQTLQCRWPHWVGGCWTARATHDVRRGGGGDGDAFPGDARPAVRDVVAGSADDLSPRGKGDHHPSHPLAELLHAVGLRWRPQETWFGERVDPAFAEKGERRSLYTARPPQSLVLCLDEMGPESARSFPGWTLVDIAEHLGARAHKEADYGRRGHGYVFGAFCPATG